MVKVESYLTVPKPWALSYMQEDIVHALAQLGGVEIVWYTSSTHGL